MSTQQGTSEAMPWLAELVESSEGSLDVLPIQCLCEFLLTSTDESKTEDPKVKQGQVCSLCQVAYDMPIIVFVHSSYLYIHLIYFAYVGIVFSSIPREKASEDKE